MSVAYSTTCSIAIFLNFTLNIIVILNVAEDSENVNVACHFQEKSFVLFSNVPLII